MMKVLKGAVWRRLSFSDDLVRLKYVADIEANYFLEGSYLYNNRAMMSNTSSETVYCEMIISVPSSNPIAFRRERERETDRFAYRRYWSSRQPEGTSSELFTYQSSRRWWRWSGAVWI